MEHIYYVQALQLLAHEFALEDDASTAAQFVEALKFEDLIKYILKKKAELPVSKFYYKAGNSTTNMLLSVTESCPEHLLVVTAGIFMLEELIGLEE